MIRNRHHRNRLQRDTATLRLGSVGYEAEPNERGERYVWLERSVLDRLRANAGRARATATSFSGSQPASARTRYKKPYGGLERPS
jgi:hypothetical protein